MAERKMSKARRSAVKIAFLNMHHASAMRGGEVFVEALSERLRKRHEIDIIAGRYLYHTRWPILWRLFLDPHGIAGLWFTLKNLRKLFSEKYDIVIPMNGGWQAIMVRVVTFLYGGRMVVSGQSGIGWDDRVNLWSFPDLFVAPTEKATRWARRVNPFVKSVYTPNGVDLKKFTPGGKRFKHGLEHPVILTVGALNGQKRISLVIRAAAHLEASLLVVGDGPDKDKLQSLGDKLLNGRFKIIKMRHDLMPEIYCSADVFVLVSNEREAFGLVYLEAMASSLALVATDDEQRREIVGDAGILVKDPENPRQLARAIKKALKKRWNSAPRRQAEKFNWDSIAGKYEELFLDLVK